MPEFHPNTRLRPPGSSRFFRGFLLGVVGVAAIAVWAVNVEIVMAGKANEGPLATVIRLMICDAIPLATLIAVWRGVHRHESLEQTLRGVFGGIGRFFGLMPTPMPFEEERF